MQTLMMNCIGAHTHSLVEHGCHSLHTLQLLYKATSCTDMPGRQLLQASIGAASECQLPLQLLAHTNANTCIAPDMAVPHGKQWCS
jgi:hypothetical protein